MKPSPLRLEWLVYPTASFRAQEVDLESTESVPIKVAAKVTYNRDSAHSVELTLQSHDDQASDARYTFNVEAIAAFTFDLEQAREAYKGTQPKALPQVIAVNVARIVYSATREFLASLTARAPHGSVFIESVLIGPEDVRICSVEPPEIVMQALFGVEPSAPTKKKATRSKSKSQ